MCIEQHITFPHPSGLSCTSPGMRTIPFWENQCRLGIAHRFYYKWLLGELRWGLWDPSTWACGCKGQSGILLPCFSISVLGCPPAIHFYINWVRFCNRIRSTCSIDVIYLYVNFYLDCRIFDVINCFRTSQNRIALTGERKVVKSRLCWYSPFCG